MFVVCLLKTNPPKKVVVPIQWFASLDIAQIFNSGASKTKLHKIFYCENLDSDPNHRLPIKRVFVDGPACYHAQIKFAFSK